MEFQPSYSCLCVLRRYSNNLLTSVEGLLRGNFWISLLGAHKSNPAACVDRCIFIYLFLEKRRASLRDM
jgi:hypothetical protein